jgi:hypothetical protein
VVPAISLADVAKGSLEIELAPVGAPVVARHEREVTPEPEERERELVVSRERCRADDRVVDRMSE